MTPEVRAAFGADVAAAIPGFRASTDLVAPRARKSALLVGTLADGTRVIAKRPLRADDAVAAWYFARECHIYRSLVGPDHPRLIFASEALLVVEYLAGGALATLRRPNATLDPATLASLLAIGARLATRTLPALPPPGSIVANLRRRMLEDPSAPLAWLLAAIERSPEAFDKARVADALRADPTTATCHGDLLLRNVVRSAASASPVVVDWECAGTYLRDWDRALLATQLAPAARAPLARDLAGARLATFRALVATALVRELKFATSFPHPRHLAALRAELADVVATI